MVVEICGDVENRIWYLVDEEGYYKYGSSFGCFKVF